MDKELRQRDQIIIQLQQHISKTQERMKVTYDKGRKDRQFEVGDWVYLKLQSYRCECMLSDFAWGRVVFMIASWCQQRALVAPNGVRGRWDDYNIATILAGAATNPFKTGYPGNLKVDKMSKARFNAYGQTIGSKFIWDPVSFNCKVIA
ncbi:hypothetical protein Patl1_00945 [Pistacia atlantica]|uniref:Uncharacterized protein n=1 Tax=Pistacia atlantica TaxID=434234 RepID=A0ACC1C6N6_9ROSI|nr:hypothetical protein Patl1_00945 [Pistacia atlantica]